jgi:predicted porin
MKKSLLALAAMGAFAGAAQAQSSVTVYGIIDVGYVGANERGTAGNATLKQTNSQFGQSAQSNSRLGFRGTEDLGGGTSAFFTVEMQINPNQTAGTTAVGAVGGNRQTFLGLAQKGIGRISIGQQYTTVFNAISKTDPGQLNNVAGSVINPQISGLTGGGSGTDGNNAAFTTRAGNMLVVQSDNFAGFQGNAFYQLNNQNNTQNGSGAVTSGGTQNSNGYGVGIDYTWNKLLLTANFQSFKGENNTSTATITVTTAGAVTGTNATDNQMYFGGVYDFGILKAYAGYIGRKITSGFNSNVTLERTAQQIGVRGNFTKTIEGWASIGNGKVTANVANAVASGNFNGWQLGSNYILSKRTNLYVIYGQEQTSSTSSGSYAASNYALGVRHTF